MRQFSNLFSKKGVFYTSLLFLIVAAAKSLLVSKQNTLPELTQQPVIGIYAQPSLEIEYPIKDYQYVLNANINWIQMSGAQAVIIPFDETQEYYDNIFSKINGILFTGGDLNINIDVPIAFQPSNLNKNQWTSNAAYLINKAISANDKGDFFPVWGTCQGFQLLHYVVSGFNYTILNHLDNDFNYTRNANLLNLEQSNLFEKFKYEWIDYSERQSPFLYLHEFGVTKDDYRYNPKLAQFFKILGISANSTDINAHDAFQYLAIVEANKYPISGVQFHPEYVLFQWGFDANLSQTSLDIAHYFSRYFINLARKNGHKFDSLQERQQYLSHNYPTVHIKDELFYQMTFMPRKQNV